MGRIYSEQRVPGPTELSSVDPGVADAVQRLLRLTESRGHRLAVQGPVAVRQLSIVFRGTGDAYPTAVAIKVCLDAKSGLPSPAAAAEYFQALRRAAAISSRQTEFVCPAGYDLLEDVGIIVVEWIEGPTLTRYLQQVSLRTAEQRLRQAGRWLAHLHGAADLGRRGVETNLLLAQLRTNRRFMKSRSGDPVLSRAMTCLAATAERIAHHSVQWTRSHGDFKSDNFVISNGRLVGLDLGLVFETPTTYDVAYFVNHLVLLSADFRAIRLFGRTARLVGAFMDGYQQVPGRGHVDQAPLTWVRLQHALRMLATLHEWSHGPKFWYLRWRLRRTIGRLQQGLEQYQAGADQGMRRS